MNTLTHTPQPARLTLTSAWRQLSADPWRWVLIAAVIAWMNASIHGFRMPWQPIVVSDANTGGGMRQLVFGAAGFLAFWRLTCTRSLGAACVRHLPWCLLGVFLLASAIWSANPNLTIKRSAIFALGLLLVLALVHVSNHPVQLMKRCVVYTVGLNAWVSIFMALALPAACSSIPARPGLAGVSSHPNTLGAVLFTGWIVSLGWAPRQHIEAVARRIAQIGIVVALVWTGSITAIIVGVVGTTTYAIFIATPYRRGALIIASGVLAVTIAGIGPEAIKGWFFDAVQRDESLSGRDVLWAEVYREGQKQRVFGGGFGSFWYEGRGRELTGTWNPRQAHNTYLDVFVDLGWVGLVGVCSLLFATVYTSLRRIIGPPGTARRSSVASLVALIIASLAIYGWSQSFLLRLDQVTMLTILWALILLGNKDGNGMADEFIIDSAPQATDIMEDSADPCGHACLI